MKNPYTTALGVLAIVLYSIAAVVWVIGYMNTSSYTTDPAQTIVLYSSAGWLFNAGFLSTLAWLVALSVGASALRRAGDVEQSEPASQHDQ